jgi:PPOX class probable F420-dependent enzyme
MFESWQQQLLADARHAILGTVAADGRAHLVPVCYALDAGAIVIAIDEKPKSGSPLARLRNIARDARVTLLIERYDDDWTELAWLRIDGRATVLDTGGERPRALLALRERYPQYGDMRLEALPLIVVEIEASRAWRWQPPD